MINQDEPALLPQAIEEMLRWTTSVKHANRTATADTELGGQQIRRGDKLLLGYESGNRDEAAFDRPDEFDIHRDPNHHLARADERPCPYRHGNVVLGFESIPVAFSPVSVQQS